MGHAPLRCPPRRALPRIHRPEKVSGAPGLELRSGGPARSFAEKASELALDGLLGPAAPGAAWEAELFCPPGTPAGALHRAGKPAWPVLGEQAPGRPVLGLVLAKEAPQRRADIPLAEALARRPRHDAHAELVGPALDAASPARLFVELLVIGADEVAVGGPLVATGKEVLKFSGDALLGPPTHGPRIIAAARTSWRLTATAVAGGFSLLRAYSALRRPAVRQRGQGIASVHRRRRLGQLGWLFSPGIPVWSPASPARQEA